VTRRRWILAGVVVAVLGVVAAVGWFWLSRDTAREVSIDEARRRAGGTTTPRRGTEGRPRPGVYEYRGGGTDSLSLPPLSQSEGPGIPGTVELLDGDCWRFRVDYSSNHWQDWKYCHRGDDLMEEGGQTWQRWLFGPVAVTTTATFRCEDTPAIPAVREPGQEWSARCKGSNTRISGEVVSAGPYRFVGEEVVDVGGERVAALHFRRSRTLTGAQDGTEVSEVWFAADDGMPLRNEREIELRTDTPVGKSTYTEKGDFRLVSLRPRS